MVRSGQIRSPDSPSQWRESCTSLPQTDQSNPWTSSKTSIHIGTTEQEINSRSRKRQGIHISQTPASHKHKKISTKKTENKKEKETRLMLSPFLTRNLKKLVNVRRLLTSPNPSLRLQPHLLQLHGRFLFRMRNLNSGIARHHDTAKRLCRTGRLRFLRQAFVGCEIGYGRATR